MRTWLMKISVSIFMLMMVSNLSGQKIEVFGGLNINKFHDYLKDEGHYMSSYETSPGLSLGVGIDSVIYEWTRFRFTLQYDNYGGELSASDGGLGGGFSTEASINKSVISLGIFPINILVIKKIELNFGVVFSGLIYESYSGTRSGWSMNYGIWSHDIHEDYSRFSSKVTVGIQGRLAYNFKLSESLWIYPQYMYYFGLSNEFKQFPDETKSIRQYFTIGIKKNLK